MENKIQNIRDNLKELQAQMRDIFHSTWKFEEENELKEQLEKWSIIEKNIYEQKSTVQWLKLGDSNSAYFYANMKGRRSQNYIKQLTSTTRRLLQRPEEIQEEIIGFYKSLLGSSQNYLPAINPNIMKEGPNLNRAQQLYLIRPFTKDKVFQAPEGIDTLKAPGCDGFN